MDWIITILAVIAALVVLYHYLVPVGTGDGRNMSEEATYLVRQMEIAYREEAVRTDNPDKAASVALTLFMNFKERYAGNHIIDNMVPQVHVNTWERKHFGDL